MGDENAVEALPIRLCSSNQRVEARKSHASDQAHSNREVGPWRDFHAMLPMHLADIATQKTAPPIHPDVGNVSRTEHLHRRKRQRDRCTLRSISRRIDRETCAQRLSTQLAERCGTFMVENPACAASTRTLMCSAEKACHGDATAVNG